MPIDDFAPGENLYRSIKKNNPDLWKANENRPSSAAFKDSKGVSVDRQLNRTDDEACKAIADRFDLKAVVYFTVAECRNCSVEVFADKLPDNEYHCLIKSANGDVKLPKSSPGLLARAARICYEVK